MDQREMVQASLMAEHDHGVYTRRKGQRRQSPGRREEDQWYPTRPVLEPASPERLAALQALAEQFRSEPHRVEVPSPGWVPFMTVKREALEHVEALLAGAEDTVQPSYGLLAGRVEDALAEVRAILGKGGQDAAPSTADPCPKCGADLNESRHADAHQWEGGCPNAG